MKSKERDLQNMHKDMQTDTWEWTGDSKGGFSFQNCWDIIRFQYPEWPFYSITWFPRNCPKMSMSLIRTMQGNS